jgi:flavin reductase (DIM6/NTAB) family NADH-FMN oxidoreductase RutF
VIVATGRTDGGGLFQRDDERSRYSAPQRALALTYVMGMTPRPGHSAVCFNVIPGVGEYFVFPALTAFGACEIMVFEGIPGGPMDCWADVTTPDEHLARSLEILARFLPWEADRCRDVALTDPNGILRGSVTPVVRHPVGRLASGALVLGMADAVVLNDPITGQGSNNAAKCADIYLAAILEQGADFDERFMRRTFDRYWRGYASSVVAWTNSFLAPPEPHVERLLEAAAELPALAETIANGFDDPQVFAPWWFDAAAADRLIAEKRSQQREPFDQRELRRAFGQFATGVVVVTTLGEDSRPVGVTANSFTSVSLDPPLLLWCLGKESTQRGAFDTARHFAVNVLSSNQHYLSRQFAIQGRDKFAGVAHMAGPSEMPLLEGALAQFVCRTTERVDAGDHIIMIGEIEHFETFDGEPLVFHSGSYRIATRHPDLDA